jgi:hypothetical protein
MPVRRSIGALKSKKMRHRSIVKQTTKPSVNIRKTGTSVTGARTPPASKRLPDDLDRRVMALQVCASGDHYAHMFGVQTRQRAVFTQRERDMLVFLKALAYFLYPLNRLWVSPMVLRDIMHDHVPESRNKTAQSLLAAGARELVKSPYRRRLMHDYVNAMHSIPDLVRIKREHALWVGGVSEALKTAVFMRAFESANRVMFVNCTAPPPALTDTRPLEEYLDRHELLGPRASIVKNFNDTDQTSEAGAARSCRDQVISTSALIDDDGGDGNDAAVGVESATSGAVHLAWMCRPPTCLDDVLKATATDALFVSRLWSRHITANAGHVCRCNSPAMQMSLRMKRRRSWNNCRCA